MSTHSPNAASWQQYKESLAPDDAFAHCGSPEPHRPHKHDVVLNEGIYRDCLCVGTPRFEAPTQSSSAFNAMTLHVASTQTSGTRRPDWDDFFLQQLPALARRSTCDRGWSTAIFVRDNDQIAAGYVGSPPGMPHCDDVGHLWDETGTHCLRTIHAEQNAMIRALRHGISLRDTTVYCTMVPCFTCAKLLVGVGVHRVVALHRYHDDVLTQELFIDASIALVIVNDDQLYEPRSKISRNENTPDFLR